MSSAVRSLADEVRQAKPQALARALSEIENRGPSADKLLSELFTGVRPALRIGVTGAPGSGKSTLTDQIAQQLRNSGKTVGIIAVDPSSPFSGGAILGDRVRMQSHDGDDGVFIRSIATRGALGGLAPAVGDAITVLEAAGRDVVIIETVGVGQAEVDIVQLAQIVVLVLTPSMGDDIQAAKAGVMEIADVFALNKADQPGIERLEQQLDAVLALLPEGQQRPPVLRTVAPEGRGLIELVAALTDPANQRYGSTGASYWRKRLQDRLAEGLLRDFLAKQPDRLTAAAEDVANGAQNPYEFITNALQPDAGIDHIGVAVRSIDSALEFYRALGIKPTHRTTVEHEQVHVAMLPVGESRIELLEATAKDSVIGRFVAKRGEGVHHVAVRVNDLEASVGAVKASGRRLVTEEIQIGAEDYRYVFVHPKSTGGILLELIEPMEAG